MKILQISSAASFGGGERYVVDLTNALTARGHELYAALRPRSPLLPQLKLPRDRIKTLPLRNALDVPSARNLALLVKQNQIEVVHAHMARDYSLAAYAARRNPRAKFIVTRHVLFPLNRLHRHTLSSATRLIAVSTAVANQLRSQQIVKESRIAMVLNGVDVSRFAGVKDRLARSRFLTEKGLASEGLLVGSIGELRTLKRHDDFLKAAAIVAKEVPGSHFVVAGVDTSPSGEVRRELDKLVSVLGLEKKVNFLGWLDDAEQLLGALDVFVSASETESFGLAIAEAMAAGTAVVATATEGAQEVIDEGTTGLRVPIGNVEALAQAIKALLLDEGRRVAMGAWAHQAVMERFSLERMVDAIENIYRVPVSTQ
jgi:glycosyltransferase involved in cell wall biosynthesis